MRRRRTAHRFGEKRRTTDVLIEEKVDFSGLMLSSDVLEGLKSAGFERPSPIQLKAIPLGRCGLDLIAQAKSGTGKTCVFSVIALENINLAMTSTQVLVLAPTREIAVQIKDVMCSIGRHLQGLQTHVFIGGMPLEDDKNHLKQCHIAIGTPGRVKHLIENQLLQTTSIRLFILDEADKLLEDSFQTQINWIYSTLPSSKQVLALSATYPDHLAEQLKNYMKDPTFVRLNAADPALEGIRHYRCVVPFHSLPHKVFHEKVESLLQLLSKLSFHQCLIFSNYQIRAKSLSETLAKNGWPSTYISGNQGQNERLKAMAKLRDFKCRILISTDLTSRGIDAERVNLVVNMDMPHDSETYLHRVGRAGRFGSYGVAVNFVAEGKESTSLNEIEVNCGVTITPLPDVVSKLLSEEMIQEASQLKSLNKVNSLNRYENETTLHKTAIDLKTSSNQNGRLAEKENVKVCLHEDAENYPQTTEDEIERNNAMIGGEGNMTEANSKIDAEHTHEAEYKLDDKNEGRNIQNVGTVDNTIEGKNIQGDSVKESEGEHEKVEDLPANADQDDDTQQESGKESFVVECQNTKNELNDTGTETSCLQRDIVDATGVGVKTEKKKSEVNDEETLSKICKHELDDEKRCRYKTDDEERGRHEIDHKERGRHKIDDGERGRHEIDDGKRGGHEIDHKERERHEIDDGEQGRYEIDHEDSKSHPDNTEDTQTSKNGKIIFRNGDTGFFTTTEQFDEEDFVIDDSESELSSSEETESSAESRDSHTPVSCKDFDNALEAYLEGGIGGNSNPRHLECKSVALGQSRDMKDDNQVYGVSKDEIYANLTHLSNKIDANACADSPGKIPQSSPHESRPWSTRNASNSEDTMFYGATSDDVNAYMTALPAEWTNTWYRVYDGQTNFIMKYTKFCQENF